MWSSHGTEISWVSSEKPTGTKQARVHNHHLSWRHTNVDGESKKNGPRAESRGDTTKAVAWALFLHHSHGGHSSTHEAAARRRPTRFKIEAQMKHELAHRSVEVDHVGGNCWDAGSTLFDSFELEALMKSLDQAAAHASGRASGVHDPEAGPEASGAQLVKHHSSSNEHHHGLWKHFLQSLHLAGSHDFGGSNNHHGHDHHGHDHHGMWKHLLHSLHRDGSHSHHDHSHDHHGMWKHLLHSLHLDGSHHSHHDHSHGHDHHGVWKHLMHSLHLDGCHNCKVAPHNSDSLENSTTSCTSHKQKVDPRHGMWKHLLHSLHLDHHGSHHSQVAPHDLLPGSPERRSSSSSSSSPGSSSPGRSSPGRDDAHHHHRHHKHAHLWKLIAHSFHHGHKHHGHKHQHHEESA